MRCELICDSVGQRHIVDLESEHHLACEVDIGGSPGWQPSLHYGGTTDQIIDQADSLVRMLRCLVINEGSIRRVIFMSDPNEDGFVCEKRESML